MRGARTAAEVDRVPLEAWVDGDCALCAGVAAWAGRRAPAGRLLLHRQADGLPRELDDRPGALDRLWVRDPSGRLLAGYSAALAVLSLLPGWRRVAFTLAQPPFAWLGPPLYRLVAVSRRGLSSALARRRPGPPPRG